MAHLLWEDKYLTGNEVVDRQHQQIFKMLNDLEEAIEQKRAQAMLDQTLGRFALYVIDHFRDEEKLMQDSAYPAYVDHKKIHDQLTIKASDFLDRYREGDSSMPLTMSRFLNDWIKNHILAEDQKIFDWIRQQKGQI